MRDRAEAVAGDLDGVGDPDGADDPDGAGVDALLCLHGEGLPRPNVRYLSGFTGSSAALLIGRGHRVLITDGRYREQAAAECPDWEVEILPPGGVDTAAIGACCRSRALTRVGYEPDGITAGKLAELRDAGSAAFVPAGGLVEARRRRKGPAEIAAMEAAAGIADAALAATAGLARAGASERDVALEIDVQMRRRGAEESAFATIVAAGPHSAIPHALPSERRLAAGDLVCIDCGAVVDGYRSDLTRVWVIGEPDAEQRRVHTAVLRAHDRALALVRPGALGDDLNRAARRELTAAGLGDRWRHGIGHGVGLAIHEAPSLRVGAGAELAAGDVVTIEPGAYRSGWGGVRIEDMVLVTDAGARPLSAAPTALRVIA